MNNRKGFTLVELLAVIVVIGLVLGIAVYGVTDIFDTSKSKSVVLDESGILKSAKIYSTEQPDSAWIEDGNYKYLCVTIEELQNEGFISKNASLGNLDKSNYIKFTKDKVTLVSDNGVIVENCNGSSTSYTITYDANGGSDAPNSQTKTFGNDLILSSDEPTREGYTFTGWNTKNDGSGTDYSSGSTYTVNKTVTLYAKWRSYTYSCPIGYTCTGDSCTSTSQCIKTVQGNITTMYYCPHDGSYQADSTCSYTGWEQSSFSLKCNDTGTTICSESTYSCSDGELKGTECWKYNRYSCPTGWTTNYTGYCEFSCGVYSAGCGTSCEGTAVCSDGSGYSCTANKVGCIDGNVYYENKKLGGSTQCKTLNKIVNCHTNATETTHCSAAGTWSKDSYLGSRAVASDEVEDGLSITDMHSTVAGTSGTTTCTVDGYTVSSIVLDANCPDDYKFDKDGVLYCNTADDYWNGKTCTVGDTGGASAVQKVTCSKTGTKKYYCDANQTYYDSSPSDCSYTETTDIIETQ